jgi:hypothetical protein
MNVNMNTLIPSVWLGSRAPSMTAICWDDDDGDLPWTAVIRFTMSLR